MLFFEDIDIGETTRLGAHTFREEEMVAFARAWDPQAFHLEAGVDTAMGEAPVDRFAESAAEYLTEESRDVVPRAELDAFHDDVDTLRDDAERLAARVARLNKRMASMSAAS